MISQLQNVTLVEIELFAICFGFQDRLVTETHICVVVYEYSACKPKLTRLQKIDWNC